MWCPCPRGGCCTATAFSARVGSFRSPSAGCQLCTASRPPCTQHLSPSWRAHTQGCWARSSSWSGSTCVCTCAGTALACRRHRARTRLSSTGARAAAPDLADDGSLPVAVGQPAEDALVLHQLPDGSVAPRLEHGSAGLRHQPAPVLATDHGHQRLPEHPAGAPWSKAGCEHGLLSGLLTMLGPRRGLDGGRLQDPGHTLLNGRASERDGRGRGPRMQACAADEPAQPSEAMPACLPEPAAGTPCGAVTSGTMT